MGSFGSKAVPGLCQALIALMPPHRTYIETHCCFARYLTADFQDCFERLKRRFLTLFWHRRIEADPSRKFFLNHVVSTGMDRFGR